MIIYKTINLINGKFYIGKDSKNNAKYYGSGILLNKAIKKYGKDNFRKEIIEDDIPTIEVLNEREKYWIKKLNAKNPNGYNLSDGGDGFVKGYIMSKETKNKIKKSLIGHAMSKETKDKIRKSLIGHTVSTETKNKLKKSKLGSIPWNKGKTGIYSKETLEKMKASTAGKIGYWAGKSRDLNTKNKISKTRIESGICKGEKNPRYVKLSKEKYEFIANSFMKKDTIKKISDELKVSTRIINRAIKELKLL